jgi:hypothetical protein
LKGEIKLHKRLSGFDSALNDVTGLVYYAVDSASGALDSFVSFFAEALGLLLEVVGGIFEIVPCILDSLAKLLARLGAGLRSVEKSDGGACCYADPECQPIVFCAHVGRYLFALFDYLLVWIPEDEDWLVYFQHCAGLSGAFQESRPASSLARRKIFVNIGRLRRPVLVLRNEG